MLQGVAGVFHLAAAIAAGLGAPELGRLEPLLALWRAEGFRVEWGQSELWRVLGQNGRLLGFPLDIGQRSRHDWLIT